jgi:hypothetical protein
VGQNPPKISVIVGNNFEGMLSSSLTLTIYTHTYRSGCSNTQIHSFMSLAALLKLLEWEVSMVFHYVVNTARL